MEEIINELEKEVPQYVRPETVTTTASTTNETLVVEAPPFHEPAMAVSQSPIPKRVIYNIPEDPADDNVCISCQ